MARIESLTAEQQAMMVVYRDRWTAIGLCTEPADRARAEAGIQLAYAAGKRPAPARIVWCQSPLSQGLTLAVVFIMKQPVRASVGASVRASVGASVRASVWDSCYGQHDSSWLAFYRYFSDVCGLAEITAPLHGLWEIAESAGWWLPHAKLCWVSERPNRLRRDAQGRLHSGDGLAIGYPDGWGVYAWHGVRVPEHVILRPDTLTATKILAEPNTEVRRVMIDRVGPERFVLESGARPIHQDDVGSLYRIDVPEDEPVVLVHVTNSTPEQDGSVRKFFLRVPPQMSRAREAVAWTFAMKEKEYDPAVES